MVLAAHGWHIHGGDLGVDLFFVLSGYLITGILIRQHEDGTLSLPHFYRRRAILLLPALVLMLGLCTLVLGHPVGALAGATYTTNVVAIVDVHAINDPFRHLWSLAEEEQFYLLWPPVLVLALRYRPRWAPVALATFAAVSIAEALALGFEGASNNRLWYGPDTHAAPILLGSLAAFIPSVARPVGRLGLAGVLAIPAAISLGVPGRFLTPLFGIAAAICLLHIAARSTGRTARLLSMRWLCALGVISYSLYLWHHPLLSFADWNPYIAYPIALVLAIESWRLLERPLLNRFSTSSLADRHEIGEPSGSHRVASTPVRGDAAAPS